MVDVFFAFLVAAITCFLGFAIGRYGDKYGGHLDAPHHWIWGIVLVVVGFIYVDNLFGVVSLAFGLGHFVSDFDDFANMRIWGVDKKHKWKFWSVE